MNKFKRKYNYVICIPILISDSRLVFEENIFFLQNLEELSHIKEKESTVLNFP